jgi:hypothetical protein
MILAVTGGRAQPVAELELRALWAACARRSVRVLRVGCCPTGVDEAVWRAACAFDGRLFALERWVADWGTHGDYGGPMRNRGMARGLTQLVARVEGVDVVKSRPMISRGPINALVCWPGGRGTASMIEESTSTGARIVSITEIVDR